MSHAIITSVLKVLWTKCTQYLPNVTCHNYLCIRSVVNKVHPLNNGLCRTQNQRSGVLKAKSESMIISIKSSGSIAGWRLAVLGETKEAGSTTKVAWNELDACDGLQWSWWGPSWRRISQQRTLHWLGICWLHGAYISVSPVPGFHQKQTQNPAVKFSILLVHWVQNHSNIWL